MEDQNTNPDILSVDEFEIPTYRNLEIPDLEEIVNVENGPRLIISKIVIENFKSYYGVKTLGPFHKNFNAVIGPNGSGKSNIIDSILFVFGFRATKIRSKKVGVLIHNSDDHSDVQSCCVTVYFYKICNEGNREDNYYEKIDGSEFEVSRVAFKDGSSYYKLNDRKVHFKEIEDALLSAGVDLVHNRFLILQGEVEQISLMKAKAVKKGEDGLLEFLEDIIGSNRFQDPIKLVEERLTHLTELKATKLRRVKLVEKQKEELKEERNVAVEFLQLENDITKANNALIQINLLKVTEQSKEVKEALEEKSKELEEVNKKFIEVENLLKEKTKSHQEFIKKCAKVMKKKDENKEKFQRYEERDVEVQVEVKHVLSTVKKLEEKIKKEESTLEEYKQIPDKQLKELDVLEKKRKKIAEEKKEEEIKFDEVMATFQNETKDLQVDKFAKESKLLELQKTVNENKQKYQLAQGELDLALSIQNKDKNKATDVERNINRLKNIIKEKSVVLKDSEEKLPDVKASLDTATKELSLLNKSDKDRKDLIRELSVKVEVARSSFMNAQNSNKVLEFLMGLKKSGKIPAIIGRLGDLGVIDEKYDVAISTACGLLDYIVVQDMNSVQRCIEELQRADVGRASFIGLDKMAVWKKHCVEKKFFPEKAPRLFDLVRISDPALAPAFYFALRDTLVANDINQATRIAYGATRYRVVTLGGDMVELSGTISGGGKVMKGKMGSHIKEDIKPKDLNQMEQKLDEMQREAQSFLEEKYKVQQNIEALQKQHRQLNISLQMTSHEIKSLQEQVRGFEDQMNELQARIKNTKSDEMKMKMLEKNVEKLRKKYDEVQKVATGMEDEIHKIQTEIMDIGGNQFKAIETKKEALTTQHEQITTAINKLTVANKTALRKAAKSEESIVKMKGELQEATEKSISLREEKVKIEAEAHELLIYLEKIDLEVKESEGELQRISESLSEYREEERESKRILTQVSKRVEKLQEEGRQAAEKAEAIETQLRSLTLHEIDEQPKEVLEKLTSEEVNQVDKQELMRNISSASEKLQHLKPNMASIQEYKEKKELYLKRAEELLMVTNLIESNKDMHKSFKKRRLDQFMKGFSQIKMKLKEMYQTITLGGNAELEFVDTLDPFSEGIIFSVRPPKKSWKNISNLSGGEKTLSSLALIFALHQYKPTPFYVMDEIDAALDFKNASIIANYIKTQTENAQFIVISLRENTFELSDRLIGIYKTFNTTKTFAYNLSRNSKLLATCASELFADAPPDAPHVNPNTKASSPNRS